jgi:anti-sigma factor RsiW
MNVPAAVTERQLHAYVDDLLPAAERAAVEALIANDAELQARVAADRQQNQGLHALFDAVMAEQRPAALEAALQRRRPGRPALAIRAAALAALVLAGGWGGWTLRAMQAPPAQASFADTFVRYAAYAHLVYLPEVRHPVEVAASEEAHLVAWLSKRLGQPLNAPKLMGLGFNLVGGRLLPSGAGPAAQFMYENETGQRLTVYVRGSEPNGRGETAFRFVRYDGVSMFYWIDHSLAYAVIGEVERERLLQIARAAYQTLNP